MILRPCVFTLICLFLCSPANPEDNMRQVKIPVRFPLDPVDKTKRIGAENIRILINGKPVKVIDLIRKRRSLSDPSERKRQFFLSFHLRSLDNLTRRMISHMVTDIFRKQDTLNLLSSDKIHRLKVGGNKISLITQIEHIIKTEFLPRSQAMQNLEMRLRDEIRDLHWILNGTLGVHFQQSALDRFVKNFSYQFSQYKRDFLSPAVCSNRISTKLLTDPKGNHYFFHFHQNRFYSFLTKLSRMLQSLRKYRYRPLFRTIITIQNELKNINLFSPDRLRAPFLENNIMFNALMFNKPETPRTGLDDNLETICRQSGGIYETVVSPGETIQKLKAHEDHFHQIIFEVDNEIKVKHIQILTPGISEKPFYKQTFSPQEICKFFSTPRRPEVNITKITVFKNRISFQLESYEMKEDDGYGLINVRLELDTHQKQTVFQTENTLRATRHQTRVSIDLPLVKETPFKLTITARDMVSGCTTQVTRQIEYHHPLPLQL